MSLWRNEELIVNLHHFISHTRTKLRPTAFSEEHGYTKSELHPSQMDTKANPRSSPERRKCCLLIGRHFGTVYESPSVEAVHVKGQRVSE